jgi:hypothetical protein
MEDEVKMTTGAGVIPRRIRPSADESDSESNWENVMATNRRRLGDSQEVRISHAT